MSSSRPAERRRPALTLRSKLIAGFVVAIIAVTVAIGVVTQLLVSDYLVKQLSERVLSTNERLGGPERGQGQPGPATDDKDRSIAQATRQLCTRDDDDFGPRQPDDSLIAVVTSTGVTGAVQGGYGDCTALTSGTRAALAGLTVNAAPVTLHLPGFGDYQVVARKAANGQVIVTGLSLADVKATQLRMMLIMALVAGSAVIVGAIAVGVVISRAMRPLERVAATARTVSSLPLHKGEVDLGVRVPARDTDTRTEVGQVGAALNQMLGHVSSALTARHESESQVRRFVADASHELRTPLAAIRGYAELAERRPDDLPAVRHALGRVRSESVRMSSLVDDLLLLARLDSGRPLAQEPVDLTVLAIDAVSDARVAGRDHRWQLDLPDDPVTVVGDGPRLQQVLTNLLANARTHTPAGTTVVTGLRIEGPMAVITVTDDGPGIGPALQPEIFGRFVRGDSSRSRAAGSTGLGLAIVAAVVSAHTGTVGVHSQPGRTVFTVRVPLGGVGADRSAAGPLTAGQPPQGAPVGRARG